MKEKFDIPQKIYIGGQEIEIKEVERCNDNNLGRCSLAAGVIEIAQTFNCNGDYKQSDSSKQNTFTHEVVHAILDTIGENELSNNEKFVCSFSGHLTSVLQQVVAENIDNFKIEYQNEI